MNILFVCSANKDRSKTAEDYFSERYPNLSFDSGGTNHKICRQYGTNPLTHEMLDWADHIFVMENKHYEWIKSNTKLKLGNKIKVLSIPDIYMYGEKDLIKILEEKADSFIKSLINE